MKQKEFHRNKSLGTISPVDVPVSALPVVQLSADQVKRSAKLAKDRKESYDSFAGGRVFGDNDALSSHQTGILGEMAVAELFATEIDQTVYQFGDGGIDLSFWEMSADVKATKTKKMQLPELLVCGDSDLTADLYILAHIIDWDPGASVRILGYATQNQIDNRDPYCHPGSTENYVVNPHELTLPPYLQVEG